MIEKFGFLEKPKEFWLKAIEKYSAAIDLITERKGGENVKIMIEKFHQSNQRITELNLEELMELVKVKLLHSKTRPGFMSRITKNNSEEKITLITSEAFRILKDLDPDKPGSLEDWPVIAKGCKKLCELHGVGIATASLILSKFYHQIPFMSDQVLHEIVVLPTQTALKYNETEFKLLFERMAKKCENLNKEVDLNNSLLEPDIHGGLREKDEEGDKESKRLGESPIVWSIRSMQYAIWSYHTTETESLSKKRKWKEADERKQTLKNLKENKNVDGDQ